RTHDVDDASRHARAFHLVPDAVSPGLAHLCENPGGSDAGLAALDCTAGASGAVPGAAGHAVVDDPGAPVRHARSVVWRTVFIAAAGYRKKCRAGRMVW